jgi:hypothetical protein
MSSIQELDLCFSQVFPKNASAPAGMKNGVAPGSPGVKQLTRRNCSLLNCEGIEADGRRPRGSRAPQRSETKISSTRLSTMTRNGLIATCFVCLLIAGTGRAHGLDSSKRLTQYHHNVWRVQDGFFPGAQLESGVSEVCSLRTLSGVCRTVFREYDTKNHVDHQRLHLRGNRIRTPWV